MLATMGRGTLHLELPPNVPLDVEFVGQEGSVVLNMGATALERLNVTSVHGDVVVTLPRISSAAFARRAIRSAR